MPSPKEIDNFKVVVMEDDARSDECTPNSSHCNQQKASKKQHIEIRVPSDPQGEDDHSHKPDTNHSEYANNRSRSALKHRMPALCPHIPILATHFAHRPAQRCGARSNTQGHCAPRQGSSMPPRVSSRLGCTAPGALSGGGDWWKRPMGGGHLMRCSDYPVAPDIAPQTRDPKMHASAIQDRVIVLDELSPDTFRARLTLSRTLSEAREVDPTKWSITEPPKATADTSSPLFVTNTKELVSSTLTISR